MTQTIGPATKMMMTMMKSRFSFGEAGTHRDRKKIKKNIARVRAVCKDTINNQEGMK